MDELDQQYEEVEDFEETDEVSDDEMTETEGNDGEETDAAGAEEEEVAEPPEAETKEPSKTDRDAEQAAKRREKERAVADQAAYERGKQDAFIGMKNIYTGEVMKDVYDVQEFMQMVEAEKQGFDPVEDFAKFRKEQMRKTEQEKAETEQRSKCATDDMKLFRDKYPDVDLEALLADAEFMDYADGKLGRFPLMEVFDKFTKLRGGYEEKAQKKAREMVAKSIASPGALSGNGTVEKAVSDEDIERYLNDAIRGKLD